jgi:ATP-dependent RNA helicase DeaD
MDKLAHLSKAELIERFLGHETSLILSRYRGARDINEQPKKFKEHGPRKSGGGSEEGFKTIVVDLGYRQNVNPSRLIGLINDTMEGKKIRIGKIDMDKTFTRIDVEERFAVEVAVRLSGAKTGSYVVNAYFEEGSGSNGGSSNGQRRQKRERISSGKKFRSDNRFEDRGGRSEHRDPQPKRFADERTMIAQKVVKTERIQRQSTPRRSDRPSFDSDRSRSRGGYGGPRGENRDRSKANQAENAIRSTKLSCILGV